MAQTIPCDVCQQEAAILLVSNTIDGETEGVGAMCVEAWCNALVKGIKAAAKAAKDQAKAAADAQVRELQAQGLLPADPAPAPQEATEAVQEAVEAARTAALDAEAEGLYNSPEAAQEAEQSDAS